jgi:hypothetical protein
MSEYQWRLLTRSTSGGYVHRYDRRTGNKSLGAARSTELEAHQLYVDASVEHHGDFKGAA